MSTELKLPAGVADLYDQVGVSVRHPGLQLDKFSPPGDQKLQLQAIQRVCEAGGDTALLRDVSRRRSWMLAACSATRFEARTVGPLTLHLARASGLENAGLHLHPIYGFACLPGSGLKGVARAYAETVWCADQDDKAAAWRSIRAAFGCASGAEKSKTWRPEGVSAPKESRAGAVVFHDAWPTEWPRLQPDIVNNHHTKYYAGEGDPGDWEDPRPVYFLAVAEGTTFDFAVSPRTAPSGDGSDLELAALAGRWLQAALVHEGAGAKTHAGYGRFGMDDLAEPAAPTQMRCIAKHTLTLATPAFLAGAGQKRDDCDLRPATLRGLLRWWWRTMHAAHLDRKDLRRLETAIWGDAERGAALAASVRRDGRPAINLFDYKDGFRPKKQFAQAHGLERPGHNTTQGLFYAAYGMDEKKGQRFYVEPGARWTVTLSARQAQLPEGGQSVDASDVLRQGEVALWLLCHYGGVGSKGQKGFGSFADIEVRGIQAVDDCRRHSADLRRVAGLFTLPPHPVAASSLEDMLTVEVATPWRDHWLALDQLGFVAQAFARKNAHDDRKSALGLPRKIHGPRGRPMNHQNGDTHKPPMTLDASGHRRHAAPVHYHLAQRGDGTLTVRMTAFPSAALPDIETSRAVLREFKDHLQSELRGRVKKHTEHGTRAPLPVAGPAGGQSGGIRRLPAAGERVQAVLLEGKTKKGGWKARHETSGLPGPIQNTGDAPSDAEPGQRVDLVVASANPREIAFRWPAERDSEPSRHDPAGATADLRPRQQGRRRR